MKIFISYARKDGVELADRLERDLRSAGHDPWLDRSRIEGGASWTDSIEAAIDGASVVLADFDSQCVRNMCHQAVEAQRRPWLRPVRASLTKPGGPLIRILAGHDLAVSAVAVTPDGKRAVSASSDSASRDGTLRVWDLETGASLRTLEGHAARVTAVAVTPDGRYLGRYTHRVGLSNQRLLRLSEEGVQFRTRGDATKTLAPDEFIHRFLQYVLPDGFVKIRHYGLMASGNATTKLEVAHRLLQGCPRIPRVVAALVAMLLAVHPPVPVPLEDWRSRLKRLTGFDVGQCPACRVGTMLPLALLRRAKPPDDTS